MPAGAVAARHAGAYSQHRGVTRQGMQTRNASNTSPRPAKRKVSPKKATPMAAAAKTRQPKKARTTKAVKPPPLFLDPGQVEMPYEEGPEETEVYPKIGEMIQVLWSNEWQVGVVIEVTPAKRVFKVAHLISHEAPEYVQELGWDREWRWVQQPKSAIVVQITAAVEANGDLLK